MIWQHSPGSCSKPGPTELDRVSVAASGSQSVRCASSAGSRQTRLRLYPSDPDAKRARRASAGARQKGRGLAPFLATGTDNRTSPGKPKNGDVPPLTVETFSVASWRPQRWR